VIHLDRVFLNSVYTFHPATRATALPSLCHCFRFFWYVLSTVVSVLNIALLEVILKIMPTLVKQSQRNDSLHDTNTLSTKDTSHTKRGHILGHFLDGLDGGNALARNAVGLHNHFQSTQRIGNHDIDWTHDRRSDQASGCSAHAGLVTQFLLHVLLQTRLPDQSQRGRREGMPHEGNGTTKEGREVLGGRFLQDFGNGFGGARGFEKGALLLFNHANGINEGGTENGGGRGGRHARILAFAEEKAKAQQNAKLWNSLQEN